VGGGGARVEGRGYGWGMYEMSFLIIIEDGGT